MTATLTITQFAGQDVPEEGLTVHPPQGGDLTIWPDGEYVFTPPAEWDSHSGAETVTTYYSYIAVDAQGQVSAATFVLDPSSENARSEDFHAWSLPGILENGDGALDYLSSSAVGVHHSPDPGHGGADAHGCLDPYGSTLDIADDLSNQILNSQYHT